jgi:predicted nucleic acid-binding protein
VASGARARVYIDTSVLVSAFSNEPLQAVALALLQAPQWDQVCASDCTVAEFTCAMQAKVLRGETPPEVAHTIHQSVKSLFTQGGLHRIAVLREDYASVQRIVPSLNCLVRGADAQDLAVASRSNITHFASLDKTQRIAAGHWLRGIECVPEV